jgi:predicted RNA binding protein YcfA (HicA-like mRNA interferase family)
MKRNAFIKYLVQNGCKLVREGSKHTLYKNIKTG